MRASAAATAAAHDGASPERRDAPVVPETPEALQFQATPSPRRAQSLPQAQQSPCTPDQALSDQDLFGSDTPSSPVRARPPASPSPDLPQEPSKGGGPMMKLDERLAAAVGRQAGGEDDGRAHSPGVAGTYDAPSFNFGGTLMPR